MKLVAEALNIPEEMMMSLDKCNIVNSFNNNHEGYYFSNNNEMHSSNPENEGDKIIKLEKKLNALEQKLSDLLGTMSK